MSGGSEYKEVFLNESREYLSTLNNALVTLEKDPAQTESIHEIFRAAHTLKGMSATMGYEPMARLTHQMETVLEPVRSGTQPLSTALVDALFQCLDQLEKWLGILSTEDSLEETDLQATLLSLQKASQNLEAASEAPTPAPSAEESWRIGESEKEVLSQAVINGFSVFKVMVELDPICAFKEVRAFMILRNINELGEVVKTQPSPEDVEKGRFQKGFTLLVVTEKDAGTIERSLMSVGEVAKVEVSPFDSEGAAGEAAPGPEMKAETHTPLEAVSEEKSFILPTVRVHTSKLDKLMELVQELAISKIRFEQVVNSQKVKELIDPLSHLHQVTDELQDEIMKVRLMPVKQIFERFPRMVRDLAKVLKKQVHLEMDGTEVELDRTVIEEMSEPLVHLLRNAIDHGIETVEERLGDGKEAFGTIRLQAKRERSYVIISVTDDGKGIDPDLVRTKSVSKGLISNEEAGKLTDEEAIRLIALPGFSTIENANEISGRGVGVDVAKTKVEAMGGTFRIQSRKGMGTTFLLRFPLTLAIINVLLVRCNGEVFAMPVVNIVETIDMVPSEKRRIQQQDAFILREEVIPLYRLQELLELKSPPSDQVAPETETVLIAEVGESRVGILVDEILRQQEVAIKPLDRLLKSVRGFSGATILGDGKIALILDVNSLIEDLKDKRFQTEYSFPEKDPFHASQP